MIILDEADKLAAKGSRERQAYCRGTQHSLLKVLEGGCGDHTLRNLIRLARLDRNVREMLDFTHFPKRYVSTFLTAPPHIAAGLEQAAWSMAESAEERVKKLEDLCANI